MVIDDFRKRFYDCIRTPIYSIDDIKHIEDCCKSRNVYDPLIESLINEFPKLYEYLYSKIRLDENIQNGVVFEYVMCATIARAFSLGNVSDVFPDSFIRDRYASTKFRHVYYGENTYLIQCGGCGNVDAFFVSDGCEVKLEFKEGIAKLPELDLPQWGDDGYIRKADMDNYFQSRSNRIYEPLKNEILGFNFISGMGSNFNDFKNDDLVKASRESYSGGCKIADYIITLDKEGNAVCVYADDISCFTRLTGEIRSSGKNYCPVFSRKCLTECLDETDFRFVDDEMSECEMSLLYFEQVKGRGSNKISRYKMNSYFFIHVKDIISVIDGVVRFRYSDIRQLKPTITVKMEMVSNRSKIMEYYNADVECRKSWRDENTGGIDMKCDKRIEDPIYRLW